ncbi:MAG: tRNA epoxyqueuosine(34) reductase QueG [Acidobacteriaceae bacterium]|nr:tRNA epoxyqueuosine(34) reductase QueG [Acidobacteriaceae bacterium]
MSLLAITAEQVVALAHDCGFELAGIAPARPLDDYARFENWRQSGMAGEMQYLTDRRGDMRNDPRNLLPTAQSVICVGKLYNTRHPYSIDHKQNGHGWISRYAWGDDYHDVLRHGLERLVEAITRVHAEPFDWKVCVDTAPLLERSYAHAAGLGWIAKNTCLINQQQGSWFFLGELLVSIPLSVGTPPPDRCGTCTRCIDACPTAAIVPKDDGTWALDARACISYLTIEKRGAMPSDFEAQLGNHIFGCDICQDVCPWNRQAAISDDPQFQPREFAPDLKQLADIGEQDFAARFHHSPIKRTKYSGFQRNVTNAIKNTLALLVALILVSGFARAGDAKLEDPLNNRGFVDFYNNQFDQALAYFEEQANLHPEDANQHNHVAQTILYREMFRDGALESELVSGNNPFLRRPKMEICSDDKQQFAAEIAASEKLSEARLQTDPDDVQALYSLGVAHGLEANYLFLVEKAWTAALHEATTARKANERIIAIDPGFTDAHLILGLNSYVVGSLPFYLRALGFLGGFHGDKQGGIRQLEEVRSKGVMNRFDAEVLLAAIYRREHEPKRAIPLLQDMASHFPDNYLIRFEMVQMYSDLGQKDSALGVLAEVQRLKSEGVPGYKSLSREKIRYLEGNLFFWYGDLDPAKADLKQVTQTADELDLNTAVMAWLRLGQVYDMQGQHQDAIQAYRQAERLAPNSGAATEAKGYIANPYKRKRANG